jgi:hypothetical protein
MWNREPDFALTPARDSFLAKLAVLSYKSVSPTASSTNPSSL